MRDECNKKNPSVIIAMEKEGNSTQKMLITIEINL